MRVVALIALSLSWCTVAKAQCPPPKPPPKKLVEDLGGPTIPKPAGKKYYMPDAYSTFEQATWLFSFYNGLNRDHSRESDAVIFHPSFIEEIRKQDEVKDLERTALLAAKQDAYALFEELSCGQSGTVTRRGGQVVMGDATSYSIHLAVGSFSVYYEATCSVGPLECCAKDGECESGYSNQAAYSCELKWTIYDTYNFSAATGTGGTGLLKRFNLLGWAGTRFSSFGYFTDHLQGRFRKCIAPEEVQTTCCLPQGAPAHAPGPTPPPNGGTPPGPTPGGGKPGPSDGPAPKSPCPECDPIARDLDLTRKGLAEVDERIKKTQAQLDANKRAQKDLDDQIKAAENETKAGGWTASGTDPEAGISKDYDATKGDGLVHVTVRDSSGKVIKEYSYPRSKTPADAKTKLDALQRIEQALDEDAAYLDKVMETERRQREKLLADLALLDKLLADCLERCKQRTAYNPGYKWRVHVGVGGDLELYNEPHQFLAMVELGYRVLPRGGDVVFVPEVKTNGTITTVSLPVGFQYDFQLPVRGLSIYPRATIGYAVSIVSTTVAGVTNRAVGHLGVASLLAGLRYTFKRRWDVFIEPVGLTTFFSKNGASLSWRLAAGAGVAF